MPIVNDLVPYILSHNDKIDFYKSNMKTFFGKNFGFMFNNQLAKTNFSCVPVKIGRHCQGWRNDFYVEDGLNRKKIFNL